MERLWLALIATALTTPLLWRAPADVAVRRTAALGLLLTFTLVELPPGLLQLPGEALRLPGLLAPLQRPSVLALLTSTPVVLLVWSMLVGAAALAAFGSGQRARVALVVAALAGVLLGGLSRGFFGTSYHQGLFSILLALLIGLAPARARDDVSSLRLLLIGVYGAAGIAKLRAPGFSFVDAETQTGLIAECLVQHCNHLEAPLARPLLALASTDATVLGLIGLIAGLVLGWELLFPLILVGPRLRIAFGAFALAFHIGVVLFFGIVFVDFLLADIVLLRTATSPRPVAPWWPRLAALVAVVFAVLVIGRVKAWPLSAFELFAAPPTAPVLWHEVVVERAGDSTTISLAEVFPAHAVASPRRWLAGCGADANDPVAGDARRRCEAWLRTIAARLDADVIRVELHQETWRRIGAGSAGVSAEAISLGPAAITTPP